MPVIEEAVWLPGGAGLAGILTRPSDPGPTKRPAVLLLDMGLTYRIGPNRLYVRLARQLAADGLPSLRFDFSGVGDSPSRTEALPFADSAPLETSQAMDWLSQYLGVQEFLLMGICSGARVAFRTACEDERVVGVALLNLRNLEEEESSDLRSVALAYDAFAVLGQRSRWRRVLTGQVNYGSALRNLWRAALRLGRRGEAIRKTSHVSDALHGLVDGGVYIGLIFSEGEFGRRYLRLVLGSRFDSLMSHARVDQFIIPLADHTFTWPQSQDALFASIRQWSASVSTDLRGDGGCPTGSDRHTAG